MKASGLEADFFARWGGLQARLIAARTRLQLTDTWMNAAPLLLASLGSAAVLWLGALLAMQSDMTIGSLVAFQSILIGFFGPVGTLVTMAGQPARQSRGPGTRARRHRRAVRPRPVGSWPNRCG